MSRDADILNRLIGRLRAAARGYRAAGSDGAGLADAFAGAADAHDRAAEVLAADVRALGEASTEAPAFDPTHRAWSDLAASPAKGRRAVAEAVERAEAELVGEFRAAVDDPAASAPVRDAMARGLDRVKAGHAAALQRLEALGG